MAAWISSSREFIPTSSNTRLSREPWNRSMRTRSATSRSREQDHPGVAHRGQVLAGEERERGRVAERPDRPAVAAGAVRLGGILDQGQPVPIGDLAQRGQVGRLAAEVHGDDRPGPLGHGRVHRGGVEVERGRVDVGEHRAGAGAGDRLGRRVERVGGADDLVPRADQEALERQDQCVGAVGDGDGLPGTHRVGHLLLERLDVGAEDEAARVDDVAGRALHVVEQVLVLAADVHQRDGHPSRLLSGGTAPTQ